MPTTETLFQSPTISSIDNADLLWVWDSSESALKKVSRSSLVGATLLNGGTIDTNGATFTIPAAGGTAAILQTGITSWTPTISGATSAGAGTYTTQVGRYAIVSGIAFVFGRVVWSAHTGTGTMLLSLPVQAAGITGMITPAAIVQSGINPSNPDAVIYVGVGASGTSAVFYSTKTDATASVAVLTVDSSGNDLAFSFTYLVA